MSEVSSDGINPEGAEHSVMHRNLGLAAQKFSNGILEPIEGMIGREDEAFVSQVSKHQV